MFRIARSSCPLALAIALAACSTNFDTSTVEGSGQKRIYQIDQAQAFQIAHDSIASVLPGRKISKVTGPTKGYSTYSRFVLDTYTQQVLVIPLEGKNESGDTVEGFNLNVSGSGTSVMIGRSKNIALYEEVQERLAATNKGVLVSATQRGTYDSPPFADETSPSSETADPDNEAERLRRLNQLRDQGLITEDEYQRKRREILDDL